VNSFEGQFSFPIKDKAPDTLANAKDYSAQIEENVISSRIKPFQFPCAKVEAKANIVTNNAPNPITLLVQKFDQMNVQFVQSQNQIMNMLTTLERN
jgi:hypothetical protein